MQLGHVPRRRRRDQLLDVMAPGLEGVAPLLEVFEPVVDAREARNRTFAMREHALDDMRRNAQPRHSRSRGPPQVVQVPLRDRAGLARAELLALQFDHSGSEPELGARESAHGGFAGRGENEPLAWAFAREQWAQHCKCRF